MTFEQSWQQSQPHEQNQAEEAVPAERTESREQISRRFSEFLREEYGLAIEESDVPDSIRELMSEAGISNSLDDFMIRDSRLYGTAFEALVREYLKSTGCEVMTKANSRGSLQPGSIIGKFGEKYISMYAIPSPSVTEVHVVPSDSSTWKEIQELRMREYDDWKELDPGTKTFEEYSAWIDTLYAQADENVLKRFRRQTQRSS